MFKDLVMDKMSNFQHDRVKITKEQHKRAVYCMKKIQNSLKLRKYINYFATMKMKL